MRVRSLILFLLLCHVALSSASEEVTDAHSEVYDWLQRMSQAQHDRSYAGTFVYLNGNQLETVEMIHLNDGQVIRERMVSLNGSAREVIRNGQSFVCIMPDARRVSVGGRNIGYKLLDLSPSSIEKLQSSYALRKYPPTRVADRSALVLGIEPNDQLRYGYRLYLDQETMLPLRNELLDAEGQRIEQTMFTRLQLDPEIDERLFKPDLESTGYSVSYHESAPQAGVEESSDWSFSSLPAGFSVEGFERLHKQNTVTEHFMLGDGLAVISVYIEPDDGKSGLQGTSSLGAMNAFGRIVDGYAVTAVGEVPVVTLKLVGEAVVKK